MAKLISILLPVLLVVMGFNAIRNYFGVIKKDRIEVLKNLIANGQETPAVLNSEYTEKTTKIKRMKMKTYEVGYTFKVDEKNYTGTTTMRNKPTEPIVNITYLPNNPSMNGMNPQEELDNSGEGDSMNLYLGIGLLIAGIGLGYYRWNVRGKTNA